MASNPELKVMFGDRTPSPKRSKREQLILVLLAIAIAAVTTLGYTLVMRISEMVAANQP